MSRNERTIQESVSTGVGDLLVPQWRGLFHTWVFFATLPLGAALLLVADGAAARVAVIVYVACLTAGFGVSAAYHRLARSPATRRRLAAWTTPSSSWSSPPRTRRCACWPSRTVGRPPPRRRVGRRSRRRCPQELRGERSANGLYLVLGWAAVAASPALIRHVPVGALVLMLAGVSPTRSARWFSSAAGLTRHRPVSATTRSARLHGGRQRLPLRHDLAPGCRLGQRLTRVSAARSG